jgi:toxin ParE1/3/4
MTAVILGEAERELAESVAYYESKETGLGWRFRTEVVEAVGWIERNAELPRLRPKGYRRRNLQAFPHYIAYVIRGEAIWIVAIAHGHRRPEFWLDRTGS